MIAAGIAAELITIDGDLAFGNAFEGSIHGVKFDDLNVDGVRDAGEPLLDGVTIQISGDDGSMDTVDTAMGGQYWFEDLEAGVTYTITEVVPDGSMQTTTDPQPILIGSGQEYVASQAQKDALIAAGIAAELITIDGDLAFGNHFIPEGCTPGFWKNHTGLGRGNQENAWAPTAYEPTGAVEYAALSHTSVERKAVNSVTVECRFVDR